MVCLTSVSKYHSDGMHTLLYKYASNRISTAITTTKATITPVASCPAVALLSLLSVTSTGLAVVSCRVL